MCQSRRRALEIMGLPCHTPRPSPCDALTAAVSCKRKLYLGPGVCCPTFRFNLGLSSYTHMLRDTSPWCPCQARWPHWLQLAWHAGTAMTIPGTYQMLTGARRITYVNSHDNPPGDTETQRGSVTCHRQLARGGRARIWTPVFCLQRPTLKIQLKTYVTGIFHKSIRNHW